MIRRIMTELEFPTEPIEFLAKKNAELSVCETVRDDLHEGTTIFSTTGRAIICHPSRELRKRAAAL